MPRGKYQHKKGRIVSLETRQKLRLVHLGKPSRLLGTKRPEEIKRKLRESTRKRYTSGEKFGFQKGHKINIGKKNTLGKHWKMSEISKQKISEASKGKSKSLEHRKKISASLKGRKQSSETIEKRRQKLLGQKRTEEQKRKISLGNKGKQIGNKSPRWIVDRTQLAQKQQRGIFAYSKWREKVKTRDNSMCKINNQDCKGNLEIHHILGYMEHPELRYEVNNGISLCQFHHPRKRSEEKRLSPYFQKLVANIQ